MRNELVIIGTGGHAKVCLDIAEKMACWSNISFVSEEKGLTEFMGYEVMGNTKMISLAIGKDFFVAIGDQEVRKAITKLLFENKASIATLIHPNTTIAKDVSIGYGTVVMAGSVINPSTKIGLGCIINTGATIDHDNRLGSFVHISPGTHLAGTVEVGDDVWLGIGVNVVNDVSICSGSIVGAGATVIKSITKTGTYVGTPAKKISSVSCF